MPENLQRWSDFLDQLEDSIAEGLRFLDDPTVPFSQEPWLPPADLGEVPEALTGRVMEIVTAQQDFINRMQAARAETKLHLDAVDAMPREGAGKPVYLDITG